MLAALWCAAMAAQTAGVEKLSPTLQRRFLAAQTSTRAPKLARTDTLLAFVRTHLPQDSLEALGCRTIDRRAGIAVVAMPQTALRALMASPRVSRIECEPAGRVALDSVRRYVRADRAHSAQAPLTQAYTGKGVVCGMVDAGLDLSHPTFRAADGTLRFVRFWDQLSRRVNYRYGGRNYTGEEAIRRAGHARSARYMNHATHVLGIEAGGGANGHYAGLAPEATLCAVDCWVGNLGTWLEDSVPESMKTATASAMAFKYIFDYAEQQGMPCVINYSIGTPMTFFSENQLWTDYVSALTGKGRIVVAAAGNSGNAFMHVSKPEGAPPTFGTAFYCNSSRQPYFSMSFVGLQGSDLRLDVYKNMYAARPDTSLTVPTSRLTWRQRSDQFTFTYAGGAQTIYGADTLLVSPYNPSDTVIYLELRTPDLSQFSGNSNWPVFALSVGPELTNRAVAVYQHNFTTYPQFFKQAGLRLEYMDHAYTVSAHTMSDSIIAVGSSAERLSYTDLQGRRHSFEVDSVYPQRAYWSSMGPTLNHLTKPDCVAPGTYVVSASSSWLLNRSDVDRPTARDIMDSTETDGKTYYWIQMSGTSMAAPVVSGAVALWLEACPTLSPADVRSLLERTCRRVDKAIPADDYPNNAYGYGEIDVYAGLLSLLGLDEAVGMGRLSAHTPVGVRFRLEGRQLFIEGLESEATVRVYSTDGSLRLQCTAHENEALNLGALPHGVYAVQLSLPDARRSGSTLVRL